MRNDDRFVWLGGEILPLPDAKINVLSPTAQFGANVFEGIRCYWNEAERQLYAFRLEEHFARLQESMKMFCLEQSYSTEDLRDAFKSVIKKNDYKEDIAVRQTVFLDGFGTWSSSGVVNMFVAPVPKSRIKNFESSGIKCCVSSWQRISEKCMSPKIKVGANYINSRMAQLEAKKNGYDSAIFMNSRGTIAEGPGSCFFMIRDGKLITPPLTASILDSITRKSLITIGKEITKLEVLEREIDRTELYICEEAFLCGSAMEITPIVSIDQFDVGDGKVGELSKKIHNAYIEIAEGNNKKYKRWLTAIYE